MLIIINRTNSCSPCHLIRTTSSSPFRLTTTLNAHRPVIHPSIQLIMSSNPVIEVAGLSSWWTPIWHIKNPSPSHYYIVERLNQPKSANHLPSSPFRRSATVQFNSINFNHIPRHPRNLNVSNYNSYQPIRPSTRPKAIKSAAIIHNYRQSQL